MVMRHYETPPPRVLAASALEISGHFQAANVREARRRRGRFDCEDDLARWTSPERDCANIKGASRDRRDTRLSSMCTISVRKFNYFVTDPSVCKPYFAIAVKVGLRG